MGNSFELRKFVAPELIFGEGAHRLVGRYAANFMAKRVLIVTDPGVRGNGWVERVERELREVSISYAIFDELTPNPKDNEVYNGAEVYQSEDCDVIIAVGGGSVIDCAKGIGILSTNCRGRLDGHSILEYAGVDEIPIPGPPLICIPTTAGSSADVSQFAIILDRARSVKVALISKLLVPDVALIDPWTTTTMDPELTAATGIDALVHGVEAYVSNASSSITDLHALEAVRLIAKHLVDAVRHPYDLGHRTAMMSASMHAGLAFSNASLGLVHSMSHSLGGMLDLPHGECNAILLENVIQFNYYAEPERYGQVAQMLGVDLANITGDERRLAALREAITELRRAVGVDQRLRDLGVTRSNLHHLAENALRDPCLITNPLQPTLEEIEEIYERTL